MKPYPLAGDLAPGPEVIHANPVDSAAPELVYAALSADGELVAVDETPRAAVASLERAGGDAPISVEYLDDPHRNPAPRTTRMPSLSLAASSLPTVTAAEVMGMSLEQAHRTLLPLFERLVYRGAVAKSYATVGGMAERFLGQNYKTAKDHPEVPSEVQGLALFPADKLHQYSAIDPDTEFGRWMATQARRESMTTLCTGSNEMCRDSCLVFTGRNPTEIYNHQRKALQTLALLREPVAFARMLVEAIGRNAARVKRAGLDFYVRLNVLSDVPWELVFPELFGELFPGVRFYDYTKVAGRTTAPNYDLTFSYSGTNEALAKREIRERNRRVAVVFLMMRARAGRWQPFKLGAKLPEEFWGLQVIDGDVSDVRPLDPPSQHSGSATPVIVGLRWKTPSGRVINPRDPAFRFVIPAYPITDSTGAEYMVASVAPRHQPITGDDA